MPNRSPSHDCALGLANRACKDEPESACDRLRGLNLFCRTTNWIGPVPVGKLQLDPLMPSSSTDAPLDFQAQVSSFRAPPPAGCTFPALRLARWRGSLRCVPPLAAAAGFCGRRALSSFLPTPRPSSSLSRPTPPRPPSFPRRSTAAWRSLPLAAWRPAAGRGERRAALTPMAGRGCPYPAGRERPCPAGR